MQAFAELLDSLSFQPARNAKLRLIETSLAAEDEASLRAEIDGYLRDHPQGCLAPMKNTKKHT